MMRCIDSPFRPRPMQSVLPALLCGTLIAAAPAKENSQNTESESWQQDEDGVVVLTSGGQSEEWTQRKYRPGDLWAYQPIRKPQVPAVAVRPPEAERSTSPPWPGGDARGGRAQNPIDAFILRKLRDKGLSPAPQADQRTLLRRATIDLTGLPPTPEQMQTFLDDEAPHAFQRAVDRLLGSPHYGEQWGRHWLDVVRYADTAGFSNDFERPNAWRYRDYVIRSFNEDKPFDEFIVEQIAGDELDPNDPENLIAVGFLRMGPWEHTGMSVAAVTRQQWLDDVTNAVGVTFLAQGLRCARCHDHKFDPVPTRDYYRMQAVFAPVQFAHRKVPFLPEENASDFAERRRRSERMLQDAREFLRSLREKHDQAVEKLLAEKGVDSVKELPEDERPKRHYGLSPLDMSLQKIYRKRIGYFRRELNRYEPYALSVYNGPLRTVRSNDPLHEMPGPKKREGTVQAVHILQGGALEAPGETVAPGVLSAVHGSNATIAPTPWNSIPDEMNGRRLALARWIASPKNPLTARVLVNRVWHYHFGKGLIDTPNNFGKTGGRPTHPELLDWLATWFIEHGWSIKKLHRLIMTSATYQQSSRHPEMGAVREIDPDNDLLAYFPARRMTAEEIRDSMLAVTGELTTEMGGPGVFPKINWEVALQPRHIMGSVAPAYQPSARPRDRHRRTIYAFHYRTLSNPMLDVFDQPDSNVSCPKRDETTVAPQALTLLNGGFTRDRALALAHRIVQGTGDPGEQIKRAFRRVYGRPPTGEELRWCRQHLAEMLEHHRRHEPDPVDPPQKVKRRMVEELTGKPFTWTETLDLMDEYEPDLKPWDVGPRTRALAEVCLVLLNSNEFLYVR